VTYRIGIDVGGTFTDICLYDEADRLLETFKTPTTPGEPGVGLRTGLTGVAAGRGVELRDLLGRTGLVVYGTTASTNAVLTGRVGAVGLLCTAGFRDVLAIREGAKDDGFDYRVDFPPPYVPRRLTLPVRERVSAEGEIEVPLEPEDIESAVELLHRERVDAVAVAFLWSFMNPAHELAARELVRRSWPGVPCVLSHEVNPIPREYRRTIATVINASLEPVMRPHLRSIEAVLRADGLTGELLVVSSGGGVLAVDEIVERPIFTVGSGPTTAPRAGLDSAQRAVAEVGAAKTLLVVDMGGTSFDLSLVRDGRVRVSRETKVGPDLLGIARVDVRSIGAGGGSIAFVDEGGVLHVGPDSAGAEPGPACYRRGGTEPTVTDADLVLGYLDAEGLLGGRLRLDLDLARVAVGKVASRLGVDETAAAYAIHATVNQNMVGGIEGITIREGVDPKDALLVAGGGACGVHVGAIAEELGIRRALIPAQAGTLSAWGALVSDIAHEFSAGRYARSDRIDVTEINELLAGCIDRARAFLAGTGRPEQTWELQGACEARYVAQIWELDVPMPGLELDEVVVEALVSRFHDLHEQTYGFAQREQPVEFLQWRVRGIARIDAPSLDDQPATTAAPAAPTHRPAYVGEGWVEMSVLTGEGARRAGAVRGPALVQELTTTILVPPDWDLDVVGGGSYMLTRRPATI
jgi:N-methylhydantoinase A